MSQALINEPQPQLNAAKATQFDSCVKLRVSIHATENCGSKGISEHKQLVQVDASVEIALKALNFCHHLLMLKNAKSNLHAFIGRKGAVGVIVQIRKWHHCSVQQGALAEFDTRGFLNAWCQQ